MDLQIHEGRVFTFGFDKEEKIRKAKGRRLKMVENGAFEDRCGGRVLRLTQEPLRSSSVPTKVGMYREAAYPLIFKAADGERIRFITTPPIYYAYCVIYSNKS